MKKSKNVIHFKMLVAYKAITYCILLLTLNLDFKLIYYYYYSFHV